MKHIHEMKERLICEMETACAEMICDDELEEDHIRCLRKLAQTVTALAEVCRMMKYMPDGRTERREPGGLTGPAVPIVK